MWILCIYLVILNLLSLLVIVISWKFPKEKKDKILQICPCKKIAENGFFLKICNYSAMGGFLLSATLLTLVEVNSYAIYSLFLSLFCAYLSWVMKK